MKVVNNFGYAFELSDKEHNFNMVLPFDHRIYDVPDYLFNKYKDMLKVIVPPIAAEVCKDNVVVIEIGDIDSESRVVKEKEPVNQSELDKAKAELIEKTFREDVTASDTVESFDIEIDMVKKKFGNYKCQYKDVNDSIKLAIALYIKKLTTLRENMKSGKKTRDKCLREGMYKVEDKKDINTFKRIYRALQKKTIELPIDLAKIYIVLVKDHNKVVQINEARRYVAKYQKDKAAKVNAHITGNSNGKNNNDKSDEGLYQADVGCADNSD